MCDLAVDVAARFHWHFLQGFGARGKEKDDRGRAIAGIMIADYFLYRRRQRDLNDLYQLHGRYRYTGGFQRSRDRGPCFGGPAEYSRISRHD